MKVAAIAHQARRSESWAALEARLDAAVAGAGADLVVLPEYAGLEAALVDAPAVLSPLEWRDRAAEHAPRWADMMAGIAQGRGCHVLAGTIPWATDGGVTNRALLFAPTGEAAHQDKLILTPYERNPMRMTAGAGLRLIETTLGKLGILICYDSEFPLLARALIEAGAEMLLVPACTELPAGQTRVRQSCRARAIEGQCLVVHAPLLGQVEGCDIIDRNTGRAGIFGPPDHGQPPSGIIAQGGTDAEGPVTAEVDLAAITSPRRSGQVANFGHWPEQAAHVGVAEIQRLS